jgi:signal transduction histidine kinase
MSLTVRLLLALLIPVALCFGGYSYLNAQLRRAEMLEEASREVRDHGTILEVATDVFLRDHRLIEMAELTENLSRADRLLGVLIYNAQGDVVQASWSVRSYRGSFGALVSEVMARRRPRALVRGRVYVYAVPIGTSRSAAPRGVAVLLRDLGYIDANLVEAVRNIRSAGLVVLFVIAMCTWLGVRRAVVRPVGDLLGAVERVAAGELDAGVVASGGDELGRLGVAFNQMTASLRKARDALEAKSEANVALVRRLHHAQRLALIGQLAASLAHQVGSPLNVILGRARYALKQGGQGARDARHFDEILRGAERISGVIEQLLQRARRARGPSCPVDLRELARSTLAFVSAECEHRGIATRLLAEDPVVVQGSPDELEQVVLNLCMNAIQAQPKGGRIECTVRAEGQEATLVVLDAGPGVPTELRRQIFEAFYTTKGQTEGTGLGLSVCEEIVQGMGGSIFVSDAAGGGARFELRLPLDARAPPPGRLP